MATIEKTIALPFRREGESFREFFLRVRREEGESATDELTPALEEKIAAIDGMLQFADRIYREHGLLDDSTELLRREREARSNHLDPWNK